MCKNKPETLSTFEFFAKFPDEEAARKFFEARFGEMAPLYRGKRSTLYRAVRSARGTPVECASRRGGTLLLR